MIKALGLIAGNSRRRTHSSRYVRFINIPVAVDLLVRQSDNLLSTSFGYHRSQSTINKRAGQDLRDLDLEYERVSSVISVMRFNCPSLRLSLRRASLRERVFENINHALKYSDWANAPCKHASLDLFRYIRWSRKWVALYFGNVRRVFKAKNILKVSYFGDSSKSDLNLTRV